MKFYGLLLLLFVCYNAFSQTHPFEGTIIYEVKLEKEVHSTEKYYFKSNMLRVERLLHPDSDTLTFIKIFHFNSGKPDTVYDNMDPSILSSLGDTSFKTEGYKMHIIERWKDPIELASHYPNKSKILMGAECNFLEVEYKPDLQSQSVRGLPYNKPIRGTSWMSNVHTFPLPEGSLFSKPVLSHVDHRIALETSIEKVNSEFNTITVTTWSATEIIPGPLPDHLFWPELVH